MTAASFLLFVDSQQVAGERVGKTQPAAFSADETVDVGRDDATHVADDVFDDSEEAEFTGHINKVTISVSE